MVNDWARTPDVDAVWDRGLELMRRHAGATFDGLLAEHVAAWQRVWDVLDIEIDGDPDVLQGLRFSSFQTYQSYHGENADLNALCKGMTGEVYFGWVFWDSEIYTHRLMMFIDPPAARNLLLYRYHRLAQAMERARATRLRRRALPVRHDHRDRGLRHLAARGPRDPRRPGGLLRHLAPRRDLRDKEFLYREGIEMLLQICRFLASAGGWSPSKGDFGFYGVMGPDEFHMMVNHNCYTNVLGKKTFEFTLAVLDEMQRGGARTCTARRWRRPSSTPEEPERWARDGREDAHPQGRADRASSSSTPATSTCRTSTSSTSRRTRSRSTRTGPTSRSSATTWSSSRTC